MDPASKPSCCYCYLATYSVGDDAVVRSSPPPSHSPPPSSDDADVRLRAALSAAYPSVSPGECPRLHALHVVSHIVRRWSDAVGDPAASEADSDSWCRAHRPHAPILLPFGSYALDVHDVDADVDCLLLCPPHLSRGDFVTSLPDLLRRPACGWPVPPASVVALPEAYTPVVKFDVSVGERAIAIDLLFARTMVPLPEMAAGAELGVAGRGGRCGPFDLASSDRILSLVDLDLEERAVGLRSLNGVRLTSKLLDLTRRHRTVYRECLRAVRLWASAAGIYSNVQGYMGGVNLALLVAHVLLSAPPNDDGTDPRSSATELLLCFFSTFAHWKWPEPVHLVPVQRSSPHLNADAAAKVGQYVWDPKANPRDGTHRMPILTCVYPAANSAYSVGRPQLRRMTAELAEAERALRKIHRGEKDWSALLRDRVGDFFARHAAFVEVRLSARTPVHLKAWERWIERIVRILAVDLEGAPPGEEEEGAAPTRVEDVRAYPYARILRNPDRAGEGPEAETVRSSSLYVALKFAPGIEEIDLTARARLFLRRARQFEEFELGMDLEILCVQGRREAEKGAKRMSWKASKRAGRGRGARAAGGGKSVGGRGAHHPTAGGNGATGQGAVVAPKPRKLDQSLSSLQAGGHPFPKRKKREKYIHTL